MSGKPGDTVTFQCRYNRSPINRHQRKYWCRLRPLTWLCPTVVSTNHYTHPHYGARVALSDFPQNGFFVVRLSQLSPEDAGSYRCGIGNRNDVLFSSMNLTISAGRADDWWVRVGEMNARRKAQENGEAQEDFNHRGCDEEKLGQGRDFKKKAFISKETGSRRKVDIRANFPTE